jgi:hypothetical protein
MRSAKLKRHKGASSGVPKCRYFFRARERGHYEPKAAWNQGFGATARLKEFLENSFYSLQRRNSSAPLVPPKPNEFDMAYSSSALRAWFGTRSIPRYRGRDFQVDGRRQNLVAQCEHRDAGLESSSAAQQVPGHRLGGTHAILRSPKKLRMACASSVSPIGVEVPCAFTYPTTSGVTPASRTALRITRKPPSCSGAGWVMW